MYQHITTFKLVHDFHQMLRHYNDKKTCLYVQWKNLFSKT